MTEPAAAPLLLHCEKCRDILEPEDLFCPNCGHEAPAPEGEYRPTERVEVHRFGCGGCGATLTWEIEVQTLLCAFCGQASLEEQPPVRMPAPREVVPFQVDRARAEAVFREWLGRGIFRPGDLRHASQLTEMRGIHLPYWAFAVDCDSYWTADTNATPAFAKADWAPCFGHHRARYEEMIVPASGALSLWEIRRLGGYHLDRSLPYSREALGGYPAEAFGVTRKRARLLAGAGFQEKLQGDCAAQLPGSRHRNLKLNPLFTGTTASPVLLPAWVMAYEYGGRRYRYLVNGQTGHGDGTAPTSPWRVAGAVLLALALLALLILLGRV